MTDKIRILFLSANPRNSSWIGVDEEARAIFEQLERGPKRDFFELFKYPALRPGDLQNLLMKHEPHIVHFSGHGSESERIILEGAGGKGKQIKTEGLVDVFRLYSDHVRIIVLNACLTKEQAVALTEVIDYTIGIDRIIGDEAAVKFAGAFYLALSYGKPIQKAFDSAKAELRFQDVRRSKGIELHTRNLPDQIIAFPFGASGDAAILRAALQDLIENTASEENTRLIRKAVLDGSVILGQEDVAEGAPKILQSTKVIGSGTALRAEVDPLTYNRLQERIFPPPPGLGPPVPGLIVIGREDSLATVKGLLKTSSPEEPDLNLTVVRGWPGVGKTTLVGVLGRDPEVLEAFPHGVLWTALERGPELMSKLADWGRILGTDELLRTPTVDEAVVKLAALLKHRRMLLIVDDIWEASDAVPFLKAATKTQCAVLATTRLTEVAEDLSRHEERIHVLPVLTEANSLILLRYLAPWPVKQHPEECRQLVTDLGYLPLALHVAGKLLKTQAKLGFSVVDLINGIREGGQILEESAPIDYRTGKAFPPTVKTLLQKSTDALDDFSRGCFAYLGVFAPKPATFNVAAMKAVWQTEDPEPVVRKLVGHGLLEPVGPSRFQMHELLVKHARSLLH